MSKVVFFGLPAHGHTNPTLPLVKELVARGEEVIYYSNEAFAEQITRAGGQFRGYQDPFLKNFSLSPERMEQFFYGLFLACKRTLEEELARVRRDAPDYLIHDSVAPWGRCFAEALRIPALSSVTTFAFNRRVMGMVRGTGVAPKDPRRAFSKVRYALKATRVGRQIRKVYAVRRPRLIDVIAGRAALNLVYTSRYFQPFADMFDEAYQFVGPIQVEREDRAALSWVPPSQGPLVYISLGTLFNREDAFFKTCFEAFGGKAFHIVLSTGGGVPPEDFGMVPDNISIHHFVPQLEVLQRVDAFITRGGMNSVSESLFYGVPVLVIPQMGEQAVVARRVEMLGAGLHVRQWDVTPGVLLQAVERLLGEARYRENSEKIGASFRAAGGVQKAVDQIFAFKQRYSR